MAATVDTQIKVDGSRHTVATITIQGDGSGDISNTIVIDASTLTPATTDIKIMSIKSSLSGFAAELKWSASFIAHSLAETETNLDFTGTGGLINNSGAGTGDILLSTYGLDANDFGTITLEMKKKNNA